VKLRDIIQTAMRWGMGTPLYFYVVLFLFFPLCLRVVLSVSLELPLSAQSVVVMNAKSGAILYQKHPFTPRFPAELTQIATALYVLHRCGDLDSLDELFTVPYDCVKDFGKGRWNQGESSPPPSARSHFCIHPGEEFSLSDLLRALFFASTHEAANCLAYHISGNIPTFTQQMHSYLKELGCQHTHFVNPHGLHHSDHQTTAYDLALMVKRALTQPCLKNMMGMRECQRPPTSMQSSYLLLQPNALLVPGSTFFYPHAIGMKVGYTPQAGYVIAAVATYQGRTIIAVLLGCSTHSNRYNEAIRLFEEAFSEQKMNRILFRSEDHSFFCPIKGVSTPVRAALGQHVSLVYFPTEEPEVHVDLMWHAFSPPITRGECIGHLLVSDEEGRVLIKAPLYAQDSVRSRWKYVATRSFLSHPFLRVIVILIFYVMLGRGLVVLSRRRSK